ncbi:hypothetical protein C8039_01660 [Halogeometricum sp. wsp3]|nr:hypothetical protein C8039_01660 [Halogeometricum sp. wsp3]
MASAAVPAPDRRQLRDVVSTCRQTPTASSRRSEQPRRETEVDYVRTAQRANEAAMEAAESLLEAPDIAEDETLESTVSR